MCNLELGRGGQTKVGLLALGCAHVNVLRLLGNHLLNWLTKRLLLLLLDELTLEWLLVEALTALDWGLVSLSLEGRLEGDSLNLLVLLLLREQRLGALHWLLKELALNGFLLLDLLVRSLLNKLLHRLAEWLLLLDELALDGLLVKRLSALDWGLVGGSLDRKGCLERGLNLLVLLREHWRLDALQWLLLLLLSELALDRLLVEALAALHWGLVALGLDLSLDGGLDLLVLLVEGLTLLPLDLLLVALEWLLVEALASLDVVWEGVGLDGYDGNKCQHHDGPKGHLAQLSFSSRRFLVVKRELEAG